MNIFMASRLRCGVILRRRPCRGGLCNSRFWVRRFYLRSAGAADQRRCHAWLRGWRRLEFVDTLGGLYERAHAEPAVVGVVYQRFRAILTRQFRISNATPDAALGAAVQGRLGGNDDKFVELMQRANAASRAARIAPADALTIVQELEKFEEQLGLKTKKKKDKS